LGVVRFWLSSKDCTKGEDRRETAKRKTKKEDAGSTYGVIGQEDKLRGAKERRKSRVSGTCFRAKHERKKGFWLWRFYLHKICHKSIDFTLGKCTCI